MVQLLWRGSLAWVALAACVSSSLAAQQGVSTSPAGKSGPAQSDTVFRQTTRRVLLDIVVTDEKGNPVHGLKKDDFTVKEDGKNQRVLSFDVEDSNKPDFVPPKLPALPANTYVNLPAEPERGPLYVIVYDMVNTDLDDQGTTYKPLLDFVDSKPAGTRFAIYVNTDGLHLIQGFTSDRERLRAALTSRGPGPHMPNRFLNGRSYGQDDPHSTIQIFNFLAQYLEGIQGRKNVIWLSSHMAVSLAPSSDHEGETDTEDLKRALGAMMRSQIAVYPINVSGPVVTEVHDAGTNGSPGSGAGGTGNYAGSTGFSATANEQMSADALATYTGGHAYYSNNDVRNMMDMAVDHGESYYTLSYSPTNEKYDYAARNIGVKLSKKGYQLAYRQLYYALPEGAEEPKQKANTPDAKFAATKETDTLYADIEHGAPMLHDLLFRAHLNITGEPALATTDQMASLQDEPAYFRTRRKNQTPKLLAPVKLQKYLIDYAVLDPQLKAFAERTGRPAALEFAAVAYDADGRMLNGIANDALASPPANSDGKGGVKFRVQQELDVPSGASWIRIAVRDKFTGHTGTLEVPLPLKTEPVVKAANPSS